MSHFCHLAGDFTILTGLWVFGIKACSPPRRLSKLSPTLWYSTSCLPSLSTLYVIPDDALPSFLVFPLAFPVDLQPPLTNLLISLTHILSIHPQRLKIEQVMIATTGARLLPQEALDVLRSRLLPLATVATPNVPEALLLLGKPDDSVQSVADLEALARGIRQKFGSRWVLVKGGHSPFTKDLKAAKTDGERQLVVDVLVGGEQPEEVVVVKIETEYCDSRHTHGTGCSLACEYFCFIP